MTLVPLAILMGLVTYPSRAIPLLLSRTDRLPKRVLDYLRLVGPAVLAALAAVDVLVPVRTLADGTRTWQLHVGVETLAVVACIGLVALRRGLLLAIVVAVALVAAARAAGIA